MIEVIYFDLGKVIVDFDFSVAARELTNLTALPFLEITDLLSDDELIFAFETGKITKHDFCRKVCARLQIDVSLEEFKQLWGNMFLPEPLLSESFLRALKTNYRLILLSNTNEIHFDYVEQKYPILENFEEYLLSYQVGCMKPDRQIYQLAIEKGGVSAERIFFTDDRLENIEAARLAGIRAVQFRSESQLKTEMTRFGIIV